MGEPAGASSPPHAVNKAATTAATAVRRELDLMMNTTRATARGRDPESPWSYLIDQTLVCVASGPICAGADTSADCFCV